MSFLPRVTCGAILLSSLILAAQPTHSGDLTLAVYTGRITEDRWFESLTTRPEFVDAWILVGAVAWPFKEYRDGGITLEIEGQVGKYYGDQDHLEFNMPVAVRFHRFPWDESVDTSIAFGLGPSWASELPQAELKYHRETQKFMAYWFLEIAAGPPGSKWGAVFRLHHRSGAFGLVADDGGANILTAGMKFPFR